MSHRIYNPEAAWQTSSPRPARWHAGALVALALLAGGSCAAAQTKNIAQFIAAPAQSGANRSAANSDGPRTAHPNDAKGIATPTANFLGTATVNGSPLQEIVGFETNSPSAAFVPTVGLQYGRSYSVGQVTCTQTTISPTLTLPYPYLQTCTVPVTFAPLYPGGHRDTVYVLDPDGMSRLAGAFVYAIGFAPQLMIQPGVTTSLTLPGNPYLYGSAVDDTGRYYVYANSDFYTVNGGVAALLGSSVGRGYNLSLDGASNLFDEGNGGASGYEYGFTAPSLCYTTAGNENNNPVIVQYTTCFDSPAVVAAGNLGTYFDADYGGEAANASGSSTYKAGLLVQTYSPLGLVKSPAPGPEVAGIFPPGGDQPVAYPLNSGNYSPARMVVDPYENVFFADPTRGISVWCGWGDNMLDAGGIDSSLSGSSNGCGGWGNSMVQLNQTVPSGEMAVDAADTLYLGSGGLQMYSMTNNYASQMTSIGVSGGAGSTALAPDGTIYVAGGNSTLNIIDRSQGSINWGSNNGQVNSQQTVTLYNGGNQPLTLSSIAISGAGYTMQPANSNGCSSGLVVAAGTICQLLVTSTPPHPGTLNGTITITSNSLNKPNAAQAIALTGYTSGIYVSAAPSPLAFGTQTKGTSANLPLTVTNTSVGSNAVGYGSTVSITSSLVSSNPAFTASLGTCSAQLAAGTTPCKIQVTFTPGAAQSYSGTIGWTEQITGGGPSQQLSVNVNGTGVPPPVPLPDTEVIHVNDLFSFVPSTLLVINDSIAVSDGMPSTVPSTLLAISDTIHVTDTAQRPLGTALGTPAISWPAPVSIVYGTPLSAAQLDATASVGGTFTYSPSVGSVLGAGTRQLSVTFTPTDTADYTPATATVSLTIKQAPLTVAVGNASRPFATANPAFPFNISGFVNGDATTVVSGAPAISTSATLNSPAANYPITGTTGTLSAANYSFSFLPGTLTVAGGASQTILFGRFPNVPRAVGQLTLAAHSTSGLPIAYSVTGPATLSGSKLTLTGIGIVTVTATQPGNATFAPATSVAQSFTVTP